MKRVTVISPITGFLVSLALMSAANADTVEARCDIYPKGEDHASASLLCHFSQRQGHVYIARADGVNYDLIPTGDAPGNYVDGTGKAAYRQSGLGKAGTIFRMATESVYVYWDASSLQQDLTSGDNPTAPFTTADYDATTILPCSQGQPDHDIKCPAGIRRGDHGSASIHIIAPDGTQRVLNFEGGNVTTPDGGDLTWGKQGDDWYIGIDYHEFYIVPDAAVTGG